LRPAVKMPAGFDMQNLHRSIILEPESIIPVCRESVENPGSLAIFP
jgi:hypothetical protein